jgi:hypothetical protein
MESMKGREVFMLLMSMRAFQIVLGVVFQIVLGVV